MTNPQDRPVWSSHLPHMRDIDTVTLDGKTYSGAELRARLAADSQSRHAIIAQARAELIAELRAAPAGYLIDWPDEPNLGHYYAEDPTDTGRCQPLAIIPKE